MAVILTSCNGQVRRVTREANSLTAAYVTNMDKGLTTRDQDQRFIRAMSSVVYEVDRNIRGNKKASETRKASEKLSSVGVDPKSDMNMDRSADPKSEEKHE